MISREELAEMRQRTEALRLAHKRLESVLDQCATKNGRI